jgi:hypothetical protein
MSASSFKILNKYSDERRLLVYLAFHTNLRIDIEEPIDWERMIESATSVKLYRDEIPVPEEEVQGFIDRKFNPLKKFWWVDKFQ